MTSYADPHWLGRAGHIPGDGDNEPCERCPIGVGEHRIGKYWYCGACTINCGTCREPVIHGENGTVDDEGNARCTSCEARELRHAHPAPPTTVHEYLVAKGRMV